MQIKPRVDLPVGKNLIDHIAILTLPFLIEPKKSLIPERDYGVQTFIDYFIKGKGILLYIILCILINQDINN